MMSDSNAFSVQSLVSLAYPMERTKSYIYIPLFLVDSESGRCSWHHVPNLNFHLKRLNNGLQENSEAETTDDETASPRTRRRRNRR